MVDEKKPHTSFRQTIEGRNEICYILLYSISTRKVNNSVMVPVPKADMQVCGKALSYGEAYERKIF